MDPIRIGRLSDFKELAPKLVKSDGVRVFVYLYRGKFYAYADKCPHQGGPACEGDVRGKTMGTVDQNGLYVESVSKEHYSIACPWHGIEYDLENGVCLTNRKLRLREYKVVVEGDNVVLVI